MLQNIRDNSQGWIAKTIIGVIVALRQRLLDQLEPVPGVRLNGSATQRIPHTLSLTFGEGDYRVLKSVLDGSLEQAPENVLLYATSNRRHLVPENQSDNDNWKRVDGELHPSEAVEDKIALSDRFGLWLSFYPFTQEHFLDVVEHWIGELASKAGLQWQRDENLDILAVRWATGRGNRNGRCAYQFARFERQVITKQNETLRQLEQLLDYAWQVGQVVTFDLDQAQASLRVLGEQGAHHGRLAGATRTPQQRMVGGQAIEELLGIAREGFTLFVDAESRTAPAATHQHQQLSQKKTKKKLTVADEVEEGTGIR